MSDACSKEVCLTDQSNNKMVTENLLTKYKEYTSAIIAFALLIIGIIFNQIGAEFFNQYFQLFLFGTAYLIIGGPVVWKAITKIPKGDVFNEFFLMSLATIGAFFIGEYAEGVAVMLFYAVGELFQDAAVNRAKKSIESLLKIQSEEVTVIKDGITQVRHPKEVELGDIIQVMAGEKVALDGELISEKGSFNTAALTGESVPDNKNTGETVLAGMINLNRVVEIKVTSRFEDTKLSKILTMVQEAVGRKARTQRFITRFAKVYTPIVVFLAVGLTFLPYFAMENYVFEDWLYRALIFLVISCPCALVISIPLGYFGGIGAASSNGILFKGSNYLDLMRQIDTVVMDKTGTLTEGVFKVQDVRVIDFDKKLFLRLVSTLESKSTHPIAKAINEYSGFASNKTAVEEVEEISGHGMKGKVEGFEVLAGNTKLLKRFNIPYNPEIEKIVETIVVVAINGAYRGYVTIADQIKADAGQAMENLHALGIRNLIMLSGDKVSIAEKVAARLGIDKAFGGLLPEEKVEKVEELKRHGARFAFVGDGVNDAPAIALADVGIAMGGLGSDASIETADVVIQTDQPSKVATAVSIGRTTHKIVWQNIALAFGVKFIVLVLGALGMATMWEAVFADVGVALLAIFNAMRIQRMEFK